MSSKTKTHREAEEALAEVQAAMRVQAAMTTVLQPMVDAAIAEVGRTWALPAQGEIARDQLVRIGDHVRELRDSLEALVPGITETAEDMGGDLLLDGDGLLEAWFETFDFES
jgi:hypothetical protein